MSSSGSNDKIDKLSGTAFESTINNYIQQLTKIEEVINMNKELILLDLVKKENVMSYIENLAFVRKQLLRTINILI